MAALAGPGRGASALSVLVELLAELPEAVVAHGSGEDGADCTD